MFHGLWGKGVVMLAVMLGRDGVGVGEKETWVTYYSLGGDEATWFMRCST